MSGPKPIPLTDAEKEEQRLAHPIRTPLDLKRTQRQEWVTLLWLQGKTYKEISEIVDVNPSTVWEDLKIIQERWRTTPTGEADIRKLALMSLRITRSEILHTIEEAKGLEVIEGPLIQDLINAGFDIKKVSKLFKPKSSYSEIAKLYDSAVDIDKTILQRYTQMPNETQAIQAAEERAMIVLDFMRDKMGPDALEGFETYYQKRLAMRRVIPNDASTK